VTKGGKLGHDVTVAKAVRKTEQQLWATAYHEAGHVVAAIAYRRGIRRQGATIVPTKGVAGSVWMLKHIPGDPSVDMLTGRMRLRIEEDVIVSLAGGAAQRGKSGDMIAIRRRIQSQSDVERARQING
jgi:hypothetical protein